MLRRFSRPMALLLVLAVALPLASCAGRNNRTRADTQYVARDVNTLYTLAKKRLDQGNYPQAAVAAPAPTPNMSPATSTRSTTPASLG